MSLQDQRLKSEMRRHAFQAQAAHAVLVQSGRDVARVLATADPSDTSEAIARKVLAQLANVDKALCQAICGQLGLMTGQSIRADSLPECLVQLGAAHAQIRFMRPLDDKGEMPCA